MRKQHFAWVYLVTAIVLIMYGAFSLIYSLTHNRAVPVLTIVFLSVGGLMFVIVIVLALYGSFHKEIPVDQPDPYHYEKEAFQKEEVEEEPKKEVKQSPRVEEQTPPKRAPRYDGGYRPNRRSDDDYSGVSYNRGGSFYISKVGSGLILRVNGNRIYDMRTNTYYRIEGNQVYEEGSGPVYEINGTRIRYAFGSYLYELSGSNINKVFGGYYASVSGNYLTRYDSAEKYDLGGSLNRMQLLTVAALLFGE